MLLSVRDLKTYFLARRGVIKAVDGVSFDVDQGQTVALVGESGCGKTVTALSILRLVAHPGQTVAGEVNYQGRDLLQLSSEEMRQVRGREIAIIFQDPMSSLNPGFNIGFQIMESLRAHQKLNRRQAEGRCMELLKETGISDVETRIRQFPHQLSGGMQQRTMIAMALSCNPQLLIADEPTTAVDVTIQAQLLELISRLAAQSQMGVILITHNLGLVARYASWVNIMYAGRVVEAAPVWELYARPGHPYTIGLLHSVPRLDSPVDERLEPIGGEPLNLFELPRGCAFRLRCTYLGEACREDLPPLERYDGDHFVACWNAFPR